jgi:hypothetical protein
VLLDDLRRYLLTGTIGTSDVFCSVMPDSPDTAVALYETGGLPSVHAMASGPGAALVEQPRVQVLVRATSYEAARTIMQAVHHWLDGARDLYLSETTSWIDTVPEVSLGATYYGWIEAVQQPFFLRTDANGRIELACNYQVIKDRDAWVEGPIPI